MSQKETHIISIYTVNKPGVLARVCQIFSRRGYNINSLVVSPGVTDEFSRMTVTADGDNNHLEQIIAQLNKLVDVMHATNHTNDCSVVRDMALIKIRVDCERRTELLQIVEHFKGQTVDLTLDSLIIEVVGSPAKLDSMFEVLKSFEIVELVRTGKMAIARSGNET